MVYPLPKYVINPLVCSWRMKKGYDVSTPGRLPDLLGDWSSLRLKEEQADAVKFLLYYDADEDPKNQSFETRLY